MQLLLIIVCVLVGAAACGDDAGGPADAGGGVGGTGGQGGTGGGFIPRRDASVPGADPVPECDTLDPLACGAGQKCDWLLRFVTDTSASVYTGCVDERNERQLGVPCEQWGRAYQTDGLTETVLVDPCAEGSFCAPDPVLRDVFTCQPLCARSSDCGAREYCASTPISATLAVPVCRPADDCDAMSQSGCAGDDACYLRTNRSGNGPLSVCFPFVVRAPRTGAVGMPCDFINECEPGSVCWGNPRVPPRLWMDSDYLCRALCSPTLDASDAGTDNADGGVDSACGAGQCVWLGDPALGLDVTGITIAPGICD